LSAPIRTTQPMAADNLGNIASPYSILLAAEAASCQWLP
jgi:hypothetical protein